MSSRLVDPMVTSLAFDLGVPVASVALLSTAFTLPFAFSQPILGPLGDLFSKTRLVQGSVLLLGLLLIASAVAPNLGVLYITRIAAGCASAAIIPIGFALVGDAVPMARRQLAISRLLAASLTGQLLGASSAGFLSEVLNWRLVFVFASVVTLLVTIAAFIRLTPVARAPSAPQQAAVGLGTAFANYMKVFQNPRAFVCFGIVIVEGAAIYGWLPFIGAFLTDHGMGGSRQAGFIIGSLAIGGLAYAVSVSSILRIVTRPTLMIIGGAFAALGLALLSLRTPWPAQASFMAIVGFGFFMLHNSVQTEVSELAPQARASAFALHSFSFYAGQAAGPALYATSLPRLGVPISLGIAAAGFLCVGVVGSILLRRPIVPRGI
jgi:predicted MFS family arabinose efflux permease